MLAPPRPRRAPSAVAAAVLVALACAGLVGCSAHADPAPSDPPVVASHTPEMVFDSDAQALAAVKKTYAEYLKVSDAIIHDGGDDPQRIRKYLADNTYQDFVNAAKDMEKAKQYSEGDTTFDTVSLQQRQPREGGEHIQVYLCEDVSQTSLLDANGEDVTPPKRTNRLPLEVGFTVHSRHDLIIDLSRVWSGDNFC